MTKSPTCPRLTEAIESRKRWSRHTTTEEIARLTRDHTCPQCPGASWVTTRYLARDPRDDPKETP